MLCGVVSEQIFVEIERARLTKQLARLKEEEGKIDEAAEILQEVAVVSATALTRRNASVKRGHSNCEVHVNLEVVLLLRTGYTAA